MSEKSASSGDRTLQLEHARSLALEQNYDEALSLVEAMLSVASDDLDALRLKGNILDLEISDENQFLTNEEKSGKLEAAKKCYERVLALSPHNVLALIDLADYWKHQGEFDQSLSYYDRAIDLLKHNHAYLALRDELEEAFEGKFDLLYQFNREAEAAECREEARRLIPDSALF